ncbi:UDP-N-acetylmuramyl tripeptide synthetase [Leifsonia sp. Root227]|uniref:MurT ligase domain-containing protein n=1 Tax=unclassified Leifsonia TaxID=2663824 RepID=UPI0006FAA9B7|nr:MurT ligase domain-containing protein [Leifsonia sp. Root227]KRC49881.1 UDP-N-acetylmuramyl tripeptide synthetase [Leifsonia sp. Root227]
MRYRLAVVAGRLARWLLRLRGGGSAVPGRVALAIAPKFLERAVAELPLGVVFVSGSNGKSTTTNMLTGILREHGLTVFTNPSGGNLPQGIASALLATVPLDGRVRADVGVIEVDEAYGVDLATILKPRGSLLLNVQIDQLNRFFEPTRVVGMLRSIGASSSEFVVVNADDDSLARVGAELLAEGRDVSTFAVAPSIIDASPNGLANVKDVSGVPAGALPVPAVFVSELDARSARLAFGGENVQVALPARGLHYAVDAAGATAMARRVLGERFRPEAVVAAMASLRTVYGRGETLRVGDEDIEIIMMKNPPSLQLNLDYLSAPPEQVFVAVDEGTPDPSWIYDIDLSSIEHVDVVSGTKAWQFATRFAYAGIPVDQVVPELKPALTAFLALPKPATGTKTMIVNYEQMMLIRKQLGFLDLEGGER